MLCVKTAEDTSRVYVVFRYSSEPVNRGIVHWYLFVW